MRNLLTSLALVLPLAFFTVPLTGCDDGALEEAGEGLDELGDDIGDTVEDAADDVEDAFDGK
jgi:hypothetical protein